MRVWASSSRLPMDADRIHRQTGILLDEIVPKLGWPGENDALRHGDRHVPGMSLLCKARAKPKGRPDAPCGDLLSVRRHLIDLQSPVQEQIEQDGIVALFKNPLRAERAVVAYETSLSSSPSLIWRTGTVPDKSAIYHGRAFSHTPDPCSP